jgi:hypothetical protein
MLILKRRELRQKLVSKNKMLTNSNNGSNVSLRGNTNFFQLENNLYCLHHFLLNYFDLSLLTGKKINKRLRKKK